MTLQLLHPFRSSDNVGKDKPIADVAKPVSTLHEPDWTKKHGNGIGLWIPNTMNHFMMVRETVDYEHSLSSGQCAWYTWGIMNAVYGNWFISRVQAGGGHPGNPRVRWAYGVLFWGGFARVQAAWLVGACGYFYGYEYLYTHVPGFKIDDPSLDGWKRPWQENQSTFRARAAASIMPVLGYVTWKGGCFRRFMWYFWTTQFCMWMYETGRTFFHANTYFLGYENKLDNDKHEIYGSLVPDLRRDIDPDTHRPEWAHSYEYLRFSHGKTAAIQMEHKAHDYQPMAYQGLVTRNPYFSFQKAAQVDRLGRWQYKSDMFCMPQVLNAKVMSGAMD